MKNFLIFLGVLFVLALLLSHVIYVLTWERWAMILLVLAFFFHYRKTKR